VSGTPSSGGAAGGRWTDEDLLELLLQGRLQDLEQARADRDAAPRLEQLAGFLARWREPLAQAPLLPPLVERRIARSVLARTTRQETGWRGDLALVARFVGDRLAASPVLRVAAAVLLLQVLALPVLAWIVWRAPQRDKVTQVRIAEEVVEPFLPAVPEAPLEELLVEPPREELRPARIAPEPGPLEVGRALSIAADSLRGSSWPQPGDDGVWQSSPALRLLVARSRAARSPGETGGPFPVDVLEPGAEAGGLERALRAELLLDLFALSGGEPLAGLGQALAALGSDARETPAVRHLEALAIERARACGLADRTAWSRLAACGAVPGARSADPLDGSWRAALRAALESVPQARAVLREQSLQAWLNAAGDPR